MQDFTQAEIDAVKQTVTERYDKPMEILLADTELRLDPDSTELVDCPALYWKASDCHFVICKLETDQFHCQFYYKGYDQFGTGIQEYDDIVTCVVTLLRVQADQKLKRNKAVK